MTAKRTPLLTVRGLTTYFHTFDGVVKAVDGVSMDVYRGETLGVVGESGCGKSVTALSVLRLLRCPPAEIRGHMEFDGRDLLNLDPEEIRTIRGNTISMIFQEPMTSLNPVLTIGEQIAESVRLHQHLSRKDARDKAVEMLKLVQIPAPESRVRDYPHNMSGGMRQRAMIAMALSCNPQLLFADEPTTALDVTVQAQIMNLMMRLKDEFRTSIVMITHDLGVIAETARRVVVMYAGRVAEEAPVRELFKDPRHPYTRGLLASMPALGRKELNGRRLKEIPGMVPSLIDPPRGCRFSPRCDMVMDRCRTQAPPMVRLGKHRRVRCWLEAENGCPKQAAEDTRT